MAFELDHLFIYTTVGAPAAEQLIQFGLTEGSANLHPGQGTANRRFFFHNLMLELLWVHDAAEAQSELTRPTYLWERWAGLGQNTCPFGLCLRPGSQPAEGVPFPCWDYQPAYLPVPLSIAVATSIHVLAEPMLFYLAFRQRQDTYSGTQAEPLNHAAGLEEATRVTLTLPQQPPFSPALQAIVEAGLIRIQAGHEYLLEIEFDHRLQGIHQDFRPALSLILRG
ncbi:MAG: VOC family protein [Leptolyngbyaceae cyanobacterium SM2_5_2]|nr:VOC family protein [Leptolyngbyaceae cyanobacterium SM2_5_2]